MHVIWNILGHTIFLVNFLFFFWGNTESDYLNAYQFLAKNWPKMGDFGCPGVPGQKWKNGSNLVLEWVARNDDALPTRSKQVGPTFWYTVFGGPPGFHRLNDKLWTPHLFKLVRWTSLTAGGAICLKRGWGRVRGVVRLESPEGSAYPKMGQNDPF